MLSGQFTLYLRSDRLPTPMAEESVVVVNAF